MTTKEDFQTLKRQMKAQITSLQLQGFNIETQINYCKAALRILELEEKLFCKEEKPHEY